MAYLGGIDSDEREMFQTLIHHFSLKLHEERARIADLTRRLECAQARISLLEAAGYGAL
jgi:hypothetical protein